MADNLPLLPQKGGLCADVRPIIREVFCEQDYLPPISVEQNAIEDLDERILPPLGQWIDKYSTACEELNNREIDLKRQHARRVCREPLPNIYQLSAPGPHDVPTWKVVQGIITRGDLLPSIEQDAGRDNSLWVQNILNRSSCDVSQVEVRGLRLDTLEPLDSYENLTVQSLSVGELVERPPPPPVPVPPPPPLPEYIVCIPPQVDFVNFTVGILHSQTLRLVNVSKLEVRLSVRPPVCRELDVMVCGTRGFTVTSGAAAELRLRFTPSDVRALKDELRVRVSAGKSFVVPIHCYMQPPILEILVPNMTWPSLTCMGSEVAVRSGGDVLELGARLLGDVHYARLLLSCDAPHADFFLLTEDAWLSLSLDTLTRDGTVLSSPFAMRPAWWRGGGSVVGGVWCHAPHAGLHSTALRVLSSTAVGRPLHLLADAVLFTPDHITLQAHEKDYDICSEDDPNCGYYVNLGTAFPNRSLSTTVLLINHSPVIYSYYWSVRAWGTCSCWEEETNTSISSDDSDRLCVGAKEAQEAEKNEASCTNYYEGLQHDLSRLPSYVSNQDYQLNMPSEARPERKNTNILWFHWLSNPVFEICVVAKNNLNMFKRKHEDTRPHVTAAETAAALVRIEPARGRAAPRSTSTLHVCAPNVGSRLGVQRAVLILILQDIPKESFPQNFYPSVVKTETVQAEPVPGHQPWSREVCEVVCCELEVWWEVVPVRFVLDPPLLHLPHSRRVKELNLTVRATQLYGCESVRATWSVPPHLPQPPLNAPPPRLAPSNSCAVTLPLPLPSLPDKYPETDVFVLTAEDGSWENHTTVTRRCDTRYPRLQPPRSWLGVVPPGAHVSTRIRVCNDTYQHICWWGNVFRWYGENPPSKLCAGKQVCEHCLERACTCALLRPGRGALPHGACKDLVYDVNAPERDGCVATLVQVRRTAGDVGNIPSAAATEARASLVCYRVLAPQLMLRALPCHGDKVPGECEGCVLDPGLKKKGAGTAVMRPSAALDLGRCTCYRLRITNLTPLPTTVRWEDPIEKEDKLRVTFIPNDFDVSSYGQVEIRVVIEALAVCGRRVWVYRARVLGAYRPLYLLLDTAVAGLEVTYEIPLGGDEQTIDTLVMKATQKEIFPWDPVTVKPSTVEEMFQEEERKRAVREENICHCKFKMVYIPEKKRPLPPPPEGEHRIELVLEPPPLTRVCRCDVCGKPVLQEHENNLCLQFTKIPLKTVRSRTITIRNQSVQAARWHATARRWPRHRNRTLIKDTWSVDVQDPGLAIQVLPSSGLLGPRASIAISVDVYADCWGLYYDQILIAIDNLEPLVVDLWVEAVGTPLVFVAQADCNTDGDDPTLWMSSSDPERIIRVKNISRSDLRLHAYILRENDHPQDELPFRLYLRFFDVLPPTCPCVTAFDSDHDLDDEQSSISEDMDTGVEVFFTADFGRQVDTDFLMEPAVSTIASKSFADLRVSLTPPEHDEIAPNATLLIRLLPLNYCGPSWYRSETEPRLVHLRQTQREGILRVSDCRICVTFCVLHVPRNDVTRIRKSFRVLNIGNGPLLIGAECNGAWHVVEGGERGKFIRRQKVSLHLPPRSSKQICVEVSINAKEACPEVMAAPPSTTPQYAEWKKTVTPLRFFDDDNILQTVSLVLALERPILRLEPAVIDFRYVTDGDTRKTYFTIQHSSRTETLELVVEWTGSAGFQLWPKQLQLAPTATARVYVQYTAGWRGGAVEGCVVVRENSSAGMWCRATLPCHATPSRDHKAHKPVHDHTDDTRLLPPPPTLL